MHGFKVMNIDPNCALRCGLFDKATADGQGEINPVITPPSIQTWALKQNFGIFLYWKSDSLPLSLLRYFTCLAFIKLLQEFSFFFYQQ